MTNDVRMIGKDVQCGQGFHRSLPGVGLKMSRTCGGKSARATTFVRPRYGSSGAVAASPRSQGPADVTIQQQKSPNNFAADFRNDLAIFVATIWLYRIHRHPGAGGYSCCHGSVDTGFGGVRRAVWRLCSRQRADCNLAGRRDGDVAIGSADISRIPMAVTSSASAIL